MRLARPFLSIHQEWENAKSHFATKGTILQPQGILRFPLFTLDRTSARPMFRQVYDVLKRAIVNGELPLGARLPSTRSLARHLGVSRNTVLNAYETLAAEGLLDGRIGSGTRVCMAVAGSCYVPAPSIPDARAMMREAHYPTTPTGFDDPDGTPLYFHRA